MYRGVPIKDKTSTNHSVLSAIPQGTVLYPFYLACISMIYQSLLITISTCLQTTQNTKISRNYILTLIILWLVVLSGSLHLIPVNVYACVSLITSQPTHTRTTTTHKNKFKGNVNLVSVCEENDLGIQSVSIVLSNLTNVLTLKSGEFNSQNLPILRYTHIRVAIRSTGKESGGVCIQSLASI